MPSRQVEQTFGLLIAFIFPGMIGLYGLSLHVPIVESWLDAPEITEFLLMIIAASGIGVFLSVVRWAIYEELLGRLFPKTATAPRTQHDDSSEQSLQGIIMQYYRYYQFCANTSVAVTGYYLAWLLSPQAAGARMAVFGLVALLFLVAVLSWSAYDSWRRDQTARQQLYLGGDESVQRSN